MATDPAIAASRLAAISLIHAKVGDAVICSATSSGDVQNPVAHISGRT